MLKLKDGFSGARSIVLPKMIVEMLEADLLSSILHITDIGYYPKAEHHYRSRQEPINQFIFICCTQGSGWYNIGGQTYQVTANQYFILPPETPHTYAADKVDPWTIYWFHFKGTVAAHYVSGNLSPKEINTNINKQNNYHTILFEEMFNTLARGYTTDNLHYVSSILHNYLGLLRYSKSLPNQNQTDEESVITTAIHFMEMNIERRMTLQEMTDVTGYSPSHFSLLFREKTGHAPLTYFNLLKTQQACFLLDSTKMKINQICYKVGFDDPYYFSRLFRKIMEVSPKEYRLRKRG